MARKKRFGRRVCFRAFAPPRGGLRLHEHQLAGSTRFRRDGTGRRPPLLLLARPSSSSRRLCHMSSVIGHWLSCLDLLRREVGLLPAARQLVLEARLRLLAHRALDLAAKTAEHASARNTRARAVPSLHSAGAHQAREERRVSRGRQPQAPPASKPPRKLGGIGTAEGAGEQGSRGAKSREGWRLLRRAPCRHAPHWPRRAARAARPSLRAAARPTPPARRGVRSARHS